MRCTANFFLALLLGLAVAACGQDSGSGSAGVSSAPSAPAQGTAGERGTAAVPKPSGGLGTGASAGAGAEMVQPASAGTCLDLVRASRFAEAIAPCTQAVREAPDNVDVAQALKQAQAAVATTAGEARDAAAAAASQAAGDAVEKGTADAMKQAGEALQP